MSRQFDPYERSSRRTNPLAGPRRSGLGHWVPLILTVTVATIGLAAWIWSEREDDEDEDGSGGYRRPDAGTDHIYTAPPGYGDSRPGEASYGTTTRPAEESSTYLARMSGALRRTPSPQQFLDGASRTVVAGVAAAGAVVGNALSSIREEDKNAYKDHKTWSEEAESRTKGTAASPSIKRRSSDPKTQSSKTSQINTKRKTVAIVVSADTNLGGMDDEDDYHHEHASILSHLPVHIDFSKIRLFVLVYAPGLKEHPLDINAPRPAGSLSSSFSNIGHDQAQSPSEDAERPLMQSSASATPAFNAIWSQAQSLVEKDTMILPFTTATGHMHLLRHLAPDYIYLQESLAGQNGDVITHLQSWLRKDVVLVVGADGGHGGLADSESEAEQATKKENWWEREDRVGRGRGVVVVEGLRVGDDWARRIEERE